MAKSVAALLDILDILKQQQQQQQQFSAFEKHLRKCRLDVYTTKQHTPLTLSFVSTYNMSSYVTISEVNNTIVKSINYTIVKLQNMEGLSHEFKFPRKAVMSINSELSSVFFNKFFKKGYEHGFYRLGNEDAYYEPYLDHDLDSDKLKVKTRENFLKPLLRKIKLDLATEDRIDLFILYGDYNIFKTPNFSHHCGKCKCTDCGFEPWKTTDEQFNMVPSEFKTNAMDYLHAEYSLVKSPCKDWRRCNFIKSRYDVNCNDEIYQKNLEQRREYQCYAARMMVLRHYGDRYTDDISHPFCRLYMWVKGLQDQEQQNHEHWNWKTYPGYILDHISQQLGDFKNFECLVQAYNMMKAILDADVVGDYHSRQCSRMFENKVKFNQEWLQSNDYEFFGCKCRHCMRDYSGYGDDDSYSDDDDY